MTAEPRRRVELLVLGPSIVTIDGSDTVIDHGGVAIDRGEIVWLGDSDEAAAQFEGRETIHAPGRIALPGLIDTHFHTAQQLLRGKLVELARRRELRLPSWRNYLIPFESVLEPEEVYLSGLLAYTNMLRVGTTCFAEAGGPHPDEMGRAAEEVGIRGILALSTADSGDDLPATMRLTTAQAIAANEDLVRRWPGGAGTRVRAWLALRQLIVCSEELWEAFRDLADALAVRVHTHLAEGTYEVDYATERWGKRPAEHLAAIGFLGPRMHAAHSVLLSDHEIDLLAEHHVSVAHCPVGNFVIGPPKVPAMLRHDIAVGIGSDGAANGSIDLFRAIHTSMVALQSSYGTPWHIRTLLPPEEFLGLATRGGARALGMAAEVGSLEVGKRADIVLVNPGTLDTWPVYDPVFTASRGVTGANVESVIVDGRVVMRDGVVLTVDEDALRRRVAHRAKQIMARFEERVG